MRPDRFSIHVPYPRPERLSAPSDEWESDPDVRTEILLRPEQALVFEHFRELYGYCTAAGYEECAYFLPTVFRHLASRPRDGIECAPQLTWWLAEQAQRIEADGLTPWIRDALRSVLDGWTEVFCVEHFDQAACAAKGWTILRDDVVETSQAVVELIDLLCQRAAHARVSEEFVEALSRSSTSTAAAWFLEVSAALRARASHRITLEAAYAGPCGRLGALVRDDAILRHAWARSREAHDATESPTYRLDLGPRLAPPALSDD